LALRVLDHVPTLISYIDASRRYRYVNHAYEAWFGHAREDIVGRSMEEVLGAAALAEARPFVDRVLAGERVTYQRMLPYKDAGSRYVSADYTPDRDDEGRVRGFFALVQDITGVKEAERSHAHLSAIIASSGDAIYCYDFEGRIISWNRSAEELFGYTEQEVLGRGVEIILPVGETDEVRTRIIPVVRAGGSIKNVETTRVRRGGLAFPALLTASPVRDPTGAPIAVSIIARDITEQRQREEHVRQLLREVNHRSKNMLAVVQAVARRTAVTSPKDFLRHFEERIHALAVSQDLIVSNDWAGVRMADLVHLQLGHLRESIDERIAITGPDLTLKPNAAQMLGIVFHELGTNAVKYGALATDGGRVSVTWSIESEPHGRRSLAIEWIESGGPAVAPPKRRGFGSVVLERMATASLGGLAVMDFREGGVSWRFRAPCGRVIEGALDELKGAITPAPKPDGRARILVVEDEMLVAFELVASLTDAGYVVLGPARSVAEANACLDAEGCDCAVLDVNLGGETVEPFANRLVEAGVPFVTVSGYSREQQPETFRRAPFLSKPIRPQALLAQLATLLESRACLASGRYR
jgi:PAS domain S-box-containing protein